MNRPVVDDGTVVVDQEGAGSTTDEGHCHNDAQHQAHNNKATAIRRNVITKRVCQNRIVFLRVGHHGMA